jgi:hypothetical protein
MDSDQVDSIADTAEAGQVSELLRDVYFELLNRQEWEFLKGPVTLTAAGDTTKPTKFTVQEGLRHLHNVWYNVASGSDVERRELKWVEPVEFLNSYGSGAAGDGKLLVTDGTQLQFYVRTDRMPSVYTTFDGETVWFDAYDSSVETSLVTSKVSAFGVSIPTFSLTDDFVPVLPNHMVPLLQSTLNSVSHVYLKQQQAGRQLAQARSRNQRVSSREYYYANAFGRR